MSADTGKEAEINARIERIRKKNEEIQRRHMEVEADKQNADVFSSSAPPSVVKSKPAPPPKTPREPRERPTKNHSQDNKVSPRQADPAPKTNANKIYSNFAEGEGPPPDPGYRFLADDERDEPRIVEVKPKKTTENEPEISLSKKSPREKPTKFGSKTRGRRNDQNFQRSPPKGQSSNKGNPGEEKWRAERAAIDEARIQRQKTAAGNWRREWDNQKFDEDDSINSRESLNAQTFSARGPLRSPPKQWGERQSFRGRGFYNRSSSNDFNNPHNNGSFSRGGDSRMPTYSPGNQDSGPSFYKSQVREESKQPTISILRRPLSTQGPKEEGVNSTVLISPSRHLVNNGQDLRVLLRSKSNEAPEITSVKRNVPERRSFGSGRVTHHYMDTRSNDEESYFKNKTFSTQDSPRSIDLSDLKNNLPCEDLRYTQKYSDQVSPRPLLSSNNLTVMASLPQRESVTERQQAGASSKPHGKADEGEESWEDYSDNEQN